MMECPPRPPRPPHKPRSPRAAAAHRAFEVAFATFLGAVFLFAGAGTLDWPGAWAAVALSCVAPVVGLFVVPHDLLVERGRRREGLEPWDRFFTVATIPVYFLGHVLCGLDRRFGWSPPLPLAVPVAAGALYLAGSLLVIWAMRVNRFFSTVVRIQADRGHAVCSSGPYAVVRHPGYVGMVLYFGAVPAIVGSLWAFVATAVFLALFVFRTAHEDRLLRERLPGYAEYAARVRWRLVPGIW